MSRREHIKFVARVKHWDQSRANMCMAAPWPWKRIGPFEAGFNGCGRRYRRAGLLHARIRTASALTLGETAERIPSVNELPYLRLQ